MNSWDIRGKFFITTNNGLIDCTGDEHARIARAYMLRISQTDMARDLPLDRLFKPLTLDEAKYHRDRGMEKHCIEFLSHGDHVDPRVYAIREWGWIRTVENKFYAWEWDDATERRLMSNEAFWKKTRANDQTWLYFISVKTGKEYGNTYGFMKEMQDVLEGVCS